MDQSFLVKVTINNLKENLSLDSKKLLTSFIFYVITGESGDYYDTIKKTLTDFLNNVTIKLEVIEDEDR